MAATLPDGRVIRKSLLLVGSSEPTVWLNASPDSGTSPLTVEFQVLAPRGVDFDSIEYDAQSDGIVDRVFTPGMPIIWRFTTPGAHVVTVGLRRNGTLIRSLQRIVYVAAAASAQDAPRAAVQAFLLALGNGQLNIAGQRMTPSGSTKYLPAFEVLLPNLASIVSSFSEPDMTFVSGSFAEFMVTREIDGVQQAFLGYVLKGSDGQWRVESL